MSGPERGAAPRSLGVFGSASGERLWTALAAAFPVAVERRGEGELRGLDAVLDLGDGSAARAAAADGLPALHLGTSEDEGPAEPAVEFRLADDAAVDARLRGAILADPRAGARAAPSPPAGATVLADHGGTALWWRQGSLRVAALAPAELGEGEALRSRLDPRRSLALLPLVAFLREVTAGAGWTPPAPRAAFLFDDPNLHWPTYGFVDLPALARHAREHGYHAALATVPLDARWAHPAALAALADSAGALSLTIHGNDHYGAELGRIASAAEATELAAQALRRAAAFRRRTGQAIEPVMVPPHEACSEATVAGLVRCGFEAISATLPYPWLGTAGPGWLTHPPEADGLVGWRALESVAGLPSILRHPLVGRSEAELRLRAFLDQPLVLYGHHGDLAAGLDILAEARAEVEAIAPGTDWCSLRAIARGAYETRRGEGSLAVRPLSRRLAVEIPAGVERLSIAPSAVASSPAPRLVVDGIPRAYNEEIALAPGTALVDVSLGDAPLDLASVASPRRRPLAVVRRLASESRDRLAPVLAR